MSISRRSLLLSAVALSAGSTVFARKPSLRIGVTDWNLKQTGKLEAVSLAKKLDFDGVQVSLGRTPIAGKLPLDDAALQAQYIAAAQKAGIAIDGSCLDILHVNYLKNDKLGPKWVSDGIRSTRGLKTKVMLLPFFGKGALETPQEMDAVADILRELGPEAEKAGVILGLENTISAQDNARILDRARSKAVLVYYDVGNSTRNGFDPIKEIRWLGAKRICQFHLKDNPHYLGEGKIDFPTILHTIKTMDYQGYANLETDCPSKSVETDMKRNLTYLRRVLQET